MSVNTRILHLAAEYMEGVKLYGGDFNAKV